MVTGFCIYVHEDISAIEAVDSTLRITEIRQVWCGVRVWNDKVLAGCIYREQKFDSVYDEAMHDLFKAA